jgi:hypothetical protein
MAKKYQPPHFQANKNIGIYYNKDLGMKKVGEYHASMKKIGDMDRNGLKIGEMAKRAEDNKKIVVAHGNLEKMMKK